jgi:hypothetical protein
MIYGKAKYGIFDVLIADVQRPIISEPVLLKPPYNLKIQKEGTHMYIYEDVPFRLMTTISTIQITSTTSTPTSNISLPSHRHHLLQWRIRTTYKVLNGM